MQKAFFDRESISLGLESLKIVVLEDLMTLLKMTSIDTKTQSPQKSRKVPESLFSLVFVARYVSSHCLKLEEKSHFIIFVNLLTLCSEFF